MKKFLFAGALVLAVGVTLYGWGYLFISSMIENNGTMAHHMSDRPWALYLHVIFGPIALLVGGFQFFAGWRSKHPAYHRWAGRIYVVSILLSAGGAGMMAYTTNAGPVAAMGFGSLAVLSVFTTLRGYYLARAGAYEQHRQWMIRSYALTYAAVTLRLQIPLFLAGFGMEFAPSYVIIAWSCWVPNMLYAEWYVRRTPTITAPQTIPVAAE